MELLLYIGVVLLIAIVIGGWMHWIEKNGQRLDRQALAVTGAPAPPAPRQLVAAAQPSQPAAHPPLQLAQWLPIIQDQPDEHPHLIVYARSGAGKTTLVKGILAQRPGQVCYVSPKPGEFGDVTYPTIRVVDDEPSYDQIEAGLRQVLRELGRRLTLGVAFQHAELTIVLDDYATLKLECPSAAKVLYKVGTIGRSLRMRLVIGTTTKRVKGLGLDGLGDALDNFVALELPKETRHIKGFLTLDERESLAIDLAGIYQLSQQPIAAAHWWMPLSVVQSVDQVERLSTWSVEHVRVATWVTAEPTISNREIARRLWPDKDSGGKASIKAKEIREAVESLTCSPVPSVPERGNTATTTIREQGTTERRVISA